VSIPDNILLTACAQDALKKFSTKSPLLPSNHTQVIHKEKRLFMLTGKAESNLLHL
jgi:hypothetical protein